MCYHWPTANVKRIAKKCCAMSITPECTLVAHPDYNNLVDTVKLLTFPTVFFITSLARRLFIV
jgi:hypothetical protein